jgi:hypothetical protein
MRLKKLPPSNVCPNRYRALARNSADLVELLDVVYKTLRETNSSSVTIHSNHAGFGPKESYGFTEPCIESYGGKLVWCDFPGNANRKLTHYELSNKEIEELYDRLSDGLFICVTQIARLGELSVNYYSNKPYTLVMINRARHWLDE